MTCNVLCVMCDGKKIDGDNGIEHSAQSTDIRREARRGNREERRGTKDEGKEAPLSSRPNEVSGGICVNIRKIPRLVALARDDKVGISHGSRFTSHGSLVTKYMNLLTFKTF